MLMLSHHWRRWLYSSDDPTGLFAEVVHFPWKEKAGSEASIPKLAGGRRKPLCSGLYHQGPFLSFQSQCRGGLR